jgi:phosphoenolpyruvate-protein phosphotransferase (PTS system enzyme I)
MPEELTGVAAAPGIVAGPVRKMIERVTDLGAPATPEDPDAEIAAAVRALAEVAESLEKKSAGASSKEVADILSAQSMMAADPALADKVEAGVRSGLPAAHAVVGAFDSFRELLSQAGGYLADRVADLDDICARTIAVLRGSPMPGIPDANDPFVLVARDLAPADTADLDPDIVLALVTLEGGPTSHTAIIARSLGVPAVVSCPSAANAPENKVVVVDGDRGVVTLHPHPALLADVDKRRTRVAELQQSSRGPGETADGQPIKVLANVGKTSEAARAADECEGIGLLRTEFMFLGRAGEPPIDEQVTMYREVFNSFAGKRVVVRTLDAGADKPVSWLDLDAGQNPALGIRGLRTARRHPQVLDNQLEAISRAARDTDARVWVMAPMVSTTREAADFVDQARERGLGKVGVMVEVPALAVCADELAGVVDFISIGTNDLCQYISAADRVIGELSDLLDHWQPALIRLVRDIVVGAGGGATPVGVCGESASDPMFALVLVGLGVSSLSMSPASAPMVRASLKAHTTVECRRLAQLALAHPDPLTARSAVAEASNLT